MCFTVTGFYVWFDVVRSRKLGVSSWSFDITRSHMRKNADCVCLKCSVLHEVCVQQLLMAGFGLADSPCLWQAHASPSPLCAVWQWLVVPAMTLRAEWMATKVAPCVSTTPLYNETHFVNERYNTCIIISLLLFVAKAAATSVTSPSVTDVLTPVRLATIK